MGEKQGAALPARRESDRELVACELAREDEAAKLQAALKRLAEIG